MLALLHGFTGSPASWDEVLRQLDGHNHVALTLSGHGPKWRAWATRDFSDEVRRVGYWLSQVPGPHHLCGYSLGARVALGVVVAYPWLVHGATLIGVNPGLQSEEAIDARTEIDNRWAALLRDEGVEAFERAWAAQPIFSTQRSLSEQARTQQHRIRLAHDEEGLAHSLTTLGLSRMPDYWPMLATIKTPVTLVVGGRDEKFVALAERAAQQIASAKVQIADDVGHNVLLESPQHVTSHLRQVCAEVFS